MNACQSRDSGSAQQVRQYRFRLVVAGVRGCDPVHHVLFRQPFEERITRAPRRIFVGQYGKLVASAGLGIWKIVDRV